MNGRKFMKKLMAFLLVAVTALCLFACGEGEQPQSTTQNIGGITGNNQTGSASTTTTTHIYADSTTACTDCTTQQGTTLDGEDVTQGDSSGDTDIATTTQGGTHTTSGQVITTTTKKGETTLKTTTTTTKKSTTTTTKKTTTTTKKTTTTSRTVATSINASSAVKHTFGTATYTRVDDNVHKVTGKCTVCGTKTTQTETHSWGSWKYDTYPTSTAQGVKYRVCSGCGTEQVTYVPPTSVNTASFPQKMFELINAERTKRGLTPFKYYSEAQSGANTRAQELMVYFSHNRPNGSKWWTITSFDKSICQAGAENIARGYGSPEDVMVAFMAANDNRTNILSTKYTHVVIGYYEGAWVQIFVKPW